MKYIDLHGNALITFTHNEAGNLLSDLLKLQLGTAGAYREEIMEKVAHVLSTINVD
jgi:hypothetical protein